MSEMIIRSTNTEALKKIADLVRLFGLEVVFLKDNETTTATPITSSLQHLPITFAEKPDVLALAGVWKNKKINPDQIEKLQEQIRQKAWGNRL